MSSRLPALRVMLLLVSLVWATPASGLPSTVPRVPAVQKTCAEAHCLFMPLVQKSIDFVRVDGVSPLCEGDFRFCLRMVGGYIETTVDVPVYNVTLNVTWGEYSEIVTPYFPVTFPGERNPFTAFSFAHPPSLEPPTAEVMSASLTNSSSTTSVPLTVVSNHPASSVTEFSVSGGLRNDHAQTVTELQGFVVFQYGTRSIPSFGVTTLAPGATTTYTSTVGRCPSRFSSCEPAPQDATVIVHGTIVP